MKNFHLSSGPFIKDQNSTHKMMRHLLISLLPIILFSFFKNGILPFLNNKVTVLGMLYPLIFILLGPIFTLVVELVYVKLVKGINSKELKKYMKSSFSIFPGLLLALVLPINTPITVLFFGCVMATIVGKMLFGGFGNNVFNPALIGYLFVMLIYGPAIAANGGYLNALEADAITTATPLSNIATVGGIGTYATLIKPFGSLFNFLVGTVPGVMGETSAILCILAFIYLVFFKVIKWEIPVVYIATVFGMTYIIGSFNNLGIWYPLFQILSGGLMFGAIFMATDPVTSPTTQIGQVLYGLFLGILTVIIRYLTPYPEGVMTSILTLNMFVFIFDKIGSKSRFNFNKSISSFIFAWILILGLGLYVGNSFKVDTSKVDTKFNIIEKEVNGDTTTYLVTQKGFSGNIKASIVLSKDIIKSVDILEVHDDYYPRITNENYIDKLINGQIKIENMDTISGATITSSAVKDMLINTLEDYRGE